jgi:hypothetical protein
MVLDENAKLKFLNASLVEKDDFCFKEATPAFQIQSDLRI